MFAQCFKLFNEDVAKYNFGLDIWEALYDLLSTLFYGDNELAMYVDNVHKTNHVTANRIFNEARRWGMSKRRTSEVVTEILELPPCDNPNCVEAINDSGTRTGTNRFDR